MSTYAALNVTVSAARDGVLTLHIEGPLDYDTSGHFAEETGRALADHPATRVLRLDCSRLSGVDSMGLSALLGLRRQLDVTGRTLHITERPPRLDRLLTITGTLDHLVGAEAATDGGQGLAGAESRAGGTAEQESDGGDPLRTQSPQERR